ncbi:hypothetical protein LTR10_019472 [Elasticomyces elasticus]|nr:hypothetical protein LTR10_019472 [Elasticomyces elasticus]KAK5039125.1 hypothetical protein LTR13_003380 [Exophiala sideris]
MGAQMYFGATKENAVSTKQNLRVSVDGPSVANRSTEGFSSLSYSLDDSQRAPHQAEGAPVSSIHNNGATNESSGLNNPLSALDEVATTAYSHKQPSQAPGSTLRAAMAALQKAGVRDEVLSQPLQNPISRSQAFTQMDFNPPTDFGEGVDPDGTLPIHEVAVGSPVPTTLVSSATGALPDHTLDFSNFQLDDVGFLEDTFLCQFTYNPSGLTIPSTPAALALDITNSLDDGDSFVQLNTKVFTSENSSRVNSHSALQVTHDEHRLFLATLAAEDANSDLCRFQRPSVSRMQRCLIAYFRHFDPHAPFIHYASFSVAKTHRSWLPMLKLNLSMADFRCSSVSADDARGWCNALI